jgi:hypothetical protein
MDILAFRYCIKEVIKMVPDAKSKKGAAKPAAKAPAPKKKGK